MAAVAVPSTPQRQLPGAFLTTPAPAPSIFSQNAQALRQQPASASTPTQQSANTISEVERAARTINDTLASEARFPELESYVSQGVSGEYDLPKNAAWNPFQPLKSYDLPQRIVEQTNAGSVAMTLGMFAPLGHAYAVVDNCLYLWDYTTPNPELIGFEENRHTIEQIKLVVPKPGVFVPQITHLIVVSTTSEMMLLGVAISKTETGAKTLSLYNTQMAIPTRGLSVRCIEASARTGRIFFSGSFTDDIYEFKYQQQEGWFSGKTQRVCHTKTGFNFVDGSNLKAITHYLGPQQRPTTIAQMAIDDSRSFLYTLTSRNEIKVWLIREALTYAIGRPYSSLLQNTGHFNARTDLLASRDVYLVSLSPIPVNEAGKLSLVVTTSTGCRLYISLTRGYGYQADVKDGPTSMQILHIRFPPPQSHPPQDGVPQQQAQPQQAPNSAQNMSVQPYGTSAPTGPGAVDSQSRFLTPTNGAHRFAPGYFLAFTDGDKEGLDKVFCAAPDSARLKNPQDPSQLSTRFAEFGQWIQLGGKMNQVQLVNDAFNSSLPSMGFGNEMAMQFDDNATEIGILTSNGVQTIRRRRLVDIFASLMRHASADEEGLEGDIKRFIRTYGRGETAATAIAVACGKGVDVTPDSRVANVTEPDVLERARSVFIEHGGKPEFNANAVVDGGSSIDSVRPSPRHEGLALYIGRLVRGIWRVPLVRESVVPGVGVGFTSSVKIERLRSIQTDLNELSKFLENDKSYIDGLAGPQALGRVSSRQEEIALQGEHRAMNSLVKLISSVVEGISFALVLFDEPIAEILAMLAEENRVAARQLTYETLFVLPTGQALAKELVKAIVNRNIASGSNVDTIADALRRRCGSFCSTDDVIIFKAQEQIKRAEQAGGQTETGRALLNESLRLFKRVAGSLTIDPGHLRDATQSYISMHFYAGAVSLALTVADEKDRAGRAVSFVKDGMPVSDPRQAAYDTRYLCYTFVFSIINALDQEEAQALINMEGPYSVAAKRRAEAYDIVNGSDDEVFQTCLYNWYLTTGRQDRLLDNTSPFIVIYLRQKAGEADRGAADLLWRYFVHHGDYLEAAATQIDLAKGAFALSLEERMGYLSRARTNASTRQSALIDSRHSRQQLLSIIDEQLELASIQDDILQRMKADPRLSADRRPDIVAKLNGQILPIDTLYNSYADQAGYHDLCILIYQVADHRNPADIRASWQELLNQTAREAAATGNTAPWSSVGDVVRNLGRRLQGSDATFPIQTLLPMLERFQLEPAAEGAPATWAVDVLLDTEVPHETLLPVLEQLYYGNEAPFVGQRRRIIASHMVYVIRRWLEESTARGERTVFGSDENASLCGDLLRALLGGRDALDSGARREAEEVQAAIQRLMR